MGSYAVFHVETDPNEASAVAPPATTTATGTGAPCERSETTSACENTGVSVEFGRKQEFALNDRGFDAKIIYKQRS